MDFSIQFSGLYIKLDNGVYFSVAYNQIISSYGYEDGKYLHQVPPYQIVLKNLYGSSTPNLIKKFVQQFHFLFVQFGQISIFLLFAIHHFSK